MKLPPKPFDGSIRNGIHISTLRGGAPPHEIFRQMAERLRMTQDYCQDVSLCLETIDHLRGQIRDWRAWANEVERTKK